MTQRLEATPPLLIRTTEALQPHGRSTSSSLVQFSYGDFSRRLGLTDRVKRALIIFLTVFFTVVAVGGAWVAEDAYIAFRTVDNFINGYGLTWNVSERVQTYTCPLWVLLLSILCSFTNEYFYTTIALSLILSLIAIGMVVRCGRGHPSVTALALLVLIFSKAFVDYSTSGLENPLSHVLMGAFLLTYLDSPLSYRQRIFVLTLIASLASVNRMDVLLIYFPPLAYEIARNVPRRGVVTPFLLGNLPFMAWEGFSLFYYGFLFPNTAYAKLGHGLSRWEMVAQGLQYFNNSFWLDPITLPSIFIAVGYLVFSKSTKGISVAIGIITYLAYVAAIGGDFMSGRFFTVPLYAAMMSLVACGPQQLSRGVTAALAALIIMNGSLLETSTIRSGMSYGADKTWSELVPPHGIADERAVYYPVTGLLPALAGNMPRGALPAPFRSSAASHPADTVRGWVLALAQDGLVDRQNASTKRVHVFHNVGIRCFFGGPTVHYIDPLGLGNALLARLPPTANSRPRVGHYFRALPKGYYMTIASGKNELSDPKLAKYYDKLHQVISGNLFDISRLVEIVKFNLGHYDELINKANYRNPKFEEEEIGNRRLIHPPEALPPEDGSATQSRQLGRVQLFVSLLTVL